MRRGCTSATPACCSTSSRTPTRSRSSSPLLAGRRWARRACPTAWDELAGRPRAAVLRRRPQAVDLPVPAGRHRPVPAARDRFGAAPPSGSPPTSAPCARVLDVGQRRVRRAHGRRPGRSRSTSAGSNPSREPGRGRPRAVVLLGGRPTKEPTHADPLREREAADVAAAMRRARCATVGRSTRRDADGRGETEPCRRATCAILLPARTSLGHLEDALDAAGIPYRAETRRSSTAPRRCATCSRCCGRSTTPPTSSRWWRAAIADLRLRRRRPVHVQGEPGGRWDLGAAARVRCPPTTRWATRCARWPSWHDARWWSSPSELLERIVARAPGARGRVRPRAAARPVAAAAVPGRPGPRVRGRRAAASLRDFLAWADLQGSEGARVLEPCCPRPTTTPCAS